MFSKAHKHTWNWLILGFIILVGCVSQQQDSDIPELVIQLSDSSYLNTAEIPYGRPVMLVYYSGECNSCHEQAKELMAWMDSLNDIRFYFITMEKWPEVKQFTEFLNIGRFNNIIAGSDTAKILPRYLNARTTPVSALYDKEKKLKGIFGNKAHIDTLLEKIRTL